MRVLVVTTWLPTRSSPGTGIFVERDIDLLARDHDVHVVHLSSTPDDPLVRSWSVETVPLTPANPLTVRAAARLLRPMIGDYDLVHSMAASALLPFRRLSPARPWVHTEHLSGILAPQTLPVTARLALPSMMRLMARPDVVVAVGERLADAIRAHRDGPVSVVPNAVEQPAIPAPRRAVLDDGLALVSVGGVIPRKGPDIAVRTVAELVHRGTDATLRWVGDGPQRDEIRRLAEQLGVAERVSLVGSLPPEGVLRELAVGDVFLLPTAGETFGVSIAEALASGRPVVVGSNGGQSEFVNEPDGVLVSTREPEAYADAVERVIRLNEERSAAEIAARTRARFTDDNRRALYGQVYDEAVKRAHARES